MTELEVVDAADRARWMAALSEVGRFDFYHLPEYHELAEATGEGRGRLLVYRRDGVAIVLPLLFRPCADVAGLERDSSQDAGSVYGYPGPLSSEPSPSKIVVGGFHDSVRELLATDRTASVFSRLNPLFDQDSLIGELGEIVPGGSTVSIDLRLAPEAQVALYRSNHVRGIRKLRALGITCDLDPETDLDEFVAIYHETMERVGATERYFFDRAYFTMLRDLLGPRLRLFVCSLNGEVIAAGLFVVSGDIIQYHLGATRTGYVELGPMKLVIDTARQWGTGAGLSVLHLGGGLGAQEDSLFHFKAGFSDRRHLFKTWRWVSDQGSYDRLNAAKIAWNSERGLEYASSDYFPLYRGRLTPRPVAGQEAMPGAIRATSSAND